MENKKYTIEQAVEWFKGLNTMQVWNIEKKYRDAVHGKNLNTIEKYAQFVYQSEIAEANPEPTTRESESVSKKPKKVDCPWCLGSSGILADGKGSKCKCCVGRGQISETKFNELVDLYGDVIGERKKSKSKQAAQFQSEAREWISVDEPKRPEKDQQVLTITADGWYRIFTYGTQRDFPSQVTDWMPLPFKPNQK